MSPLLQHAKNYWIALRIRTLSLAVSGVGAGLLAAEYHLSLGLYGSLQGLALILLIFTAGVAAQAGANLINDFFEGSFHYQDNSEVTISLFGYTRTVFDVAVFASGIAALGAAALIGLYLVWITDWILLLIGLAGIGGAYAYTGEPFVYKRFGLGVPLSFVLMGPLMNLGAWYAVTATLSWYPVLFGLPAALFVPALMLSNEMRDFYNDRGSGLATLSVRMGRRWSILVYDLLIGGAFVLTLLYAAAGVYPPATVAVIAAFPLAISGHKKVCGDDTVSISATNRLHIVFSLLLLSALLFSL
ncbi:MAG: prenyltransferase [bacterium]